MLRTTFVGLAASLALCAGSPFTPTALAQVGTAITYQGQIKNLGNAVTTATDMQFSLWTLASGGSQVGSTVTSLAVPVSQGLFTAPLDFGVNPYTADQSVYLQIAVRNPAGVGNYVPMTTRQKFTPAPFSLATRGINVGPANTVGIGAAPWNTNNVSLTLGSVGGSAAASILFDARNGFNWGLSVFNGTDNYGDFTLSRQNLDFPFVIRGDSSNILLNGGGTGNVGIGTTTPAEKLDVNGNIRLPDVAVIGGRQGNTVTGSLTIQAPGTIASDPAGSLGGNLVLRAGNANGSCGPVPPLGMSLNNNVQIYAGDNSFQGACGTNFNGNIQFFAGNGQPERARIVGDNGMLLIGTTTATAGFLLDIAGNARCVNLTQTSSRELKEDIAPLTGALDSIMKLRGVSYAWNDKAPAQVRGAHDIGFIADEMNAVLPDIVAKDESGKPIGIDYGKVTPVAVEAIKQLKGENDLLKARLEKLEALMAARAAQPAGAAK
jgi:hypothetical protein